MFNSVAQLCLKKVVFPFHFHHIKRTMKTSMPANERRRPRPHNVYNVFFLLSAWGLIQRPMHLLVNQKPTSYRNLMTLMDMNPLLFPIFLHATSICICQWGGSCRERIPNESIQSPTAPVSKMSACCNRLTTLLLLSVCWTYNIISPSFYSITTLLWIATDGCVEL